MNFACQTIHQALERYPGIRSVDVQEATIDEEAGGVFPTAISLTIHPDTLGFYTLEFMVWALADMRRAGAFWVLRQFYLKFLADSSGGACARPYMQSVVGCNKNSKEKIP